MVFVRDALFSLCRCLGVSLSSNILHLPVYADADEFLKDLLMDWSLLRPHVNPLLLRPELLYRNVVPVSERSIYGASCGSHSVLCPRCTTSPSYVALRMLSEGKSSSFFCCKITNVLIRFIWIFYIPEKGPDFLIRTFIAGMLEALRRWQWNFCELLKFVSK